MSELSFAAVFDSNVFLQAMISREGPAGQAKREVDQGHVVLFVSYRVIDEAREVGKRPFLRQEYGVTPEQVDAFLDDVRSRTVNVSDVPHVYDNPFDPDDSHFVDLALAVGATCIVTRDNDLLNLMDEGRSEGSEFR